MQTQFLTQKLPYNNIVSEKHQQLHSNYDCLEARKPLFNSLVAMNFLTDRPDTVLLKQPNLSPVTTCEPILKQQTDSESVQRAEFEPHNCDDGNGLNTVALLTTQKYTNNNNATEQSRETILKTTNRNKIKKIPKSKLLILNKLQALLTKIFLNQHICIIDLDLRPPELHILVEILIRKNKALSLRK